MKKRSIQHPERVSKVLTVDRPSTPRRSKGHAPQPKPALPLVSWDEVLGRR